MERVLVTGAAGFVGGHLRAELGPAFDAFEGDVLDAEALRRAVRGAGAVVHLAAESSVGSSWDDPLRFWRVNVDGTVNVLDAVRAQRREARVLVASTAEVYGRAERIPTREDEPVRPLSPYARTKAAAELACSVSGLDVVVVRPANHEGPGRDERFAVGSWSRQIARLESEGGGTLYVGDLTPERDIVDVRDVCRAYRLLLDRSVPTGTYNVGSGQTVTMAHVLELLVEHAHVPVQVERDESRVRPAEIPRLAGEPARLEAATGWRPEIPLEQTLADTLGAARDLEPAR
ncbi:MAG TPA: GDP-mannose 4,6-dehydratase [Gaiellaceae bacterium]|nr:GDP-mannose 4,6-dehydratase [Gaiellaceae bacterium]